MAAMTTLPPCQNPLCKGRTMHLQKETDEHWAFVCLRCQCIRVWTKPKLRGAARIKAEVQRELERQQRIRHHESRPRYFDMGRSGASR